MIHLNNISTDITDAQKYNETIPLTNITWKFNYSEKRILSYAPQQGVSQLIKILNGDLIPKQGEVTAFDLELNSLDSANRKKWLIERVSFYTSENQLLPHLNTIENILLPIKNLQKNTITYETRAKAILAYLGLPTLVKKFPKKLSPTEYELINLARCFIIQPLMVIFEIQNTSTTVQKWLNKLAIGTQTGLVILIPENTTNLPFFYPVDHFYNGKIFCDSEKSK